MPEGIIMMTQCLNGHIKAQHRKAVDILIGAERSDSAGAAKQRVDGGGGEAELTKLTQVKSQHCFCAFPFIVFIFSA